MKSVSFRFDVDTLQCIDVGVPALCSILESHDLRCTFFVNFGRSISHSQQLVRRLLPKSQELDFEEYVDGLSAYERLGFKNYFRTAMFNPTLTSRKAGLSRLAASDNEVGLHGGRNHESWACSAHKWNVERLKAELSFGVNQFYEHFPKHSLQGFSSPEWNSPYDLGAVCKSFGINYIADEYRYLFPGNYKSTGSLESFRIIHGRSVQNKVSDIDYPITAGVFGRNGLGFFEGCATQSLSKGRVTALVLLVLESHDHLIIYDHPHFVGGSGKKIFANLIVDLVSEGVVVKTINEELSY